MSLPARTANAAAVFAGACLIAAQAMAAPPAWTVDKGGSKLAFRSSFSGMPFEGVFNRWDAQIAFDPKQLGASKVNVVIDMGSASTHEETRDEALPSDDWFAVKQFPRASFTASSFKSLGGNRYQAAGVLTIRGVSRPVVLPFTLNIAGPVAKMQGQLVVNRTAFGVGQGEFKSAETVPLDVTIAVDLTAHRAG
jgi:polyisoprenoid-binding protein YceI